MQKLFTTVQSCDFIYSISQKRCKQLHQIHSFNIYTHDDSKDKPMTMQCFNCTDQEYAQFDCFLQKPGVHLACKQLGKREDTPLFLRGTGGLLGSCQHIFPELAYSCQNSSVSYRDEDRSNNTTAYPFHCWSLIKYILFYFSPNSVPEAMVSQLPQSSCSKPAAYQNQFSCCKPPTQTHAESLIIAGYFWSLQQMMFGKHSRRTQLPAFKSSAAADHP